MGGLDTVKLHRFATGGRDDPPFVALTADATDETRRQCRGGRIDAYLTKPVDVEELIVAGRPPDPARRCRRAPGRAARPRPAAPATRARRPRRCSITSCLERLRQLDEEDDFLQPDPQRLHRRRRAAGRPSSRPPRAAGDATTFRDRAHALRSSAAHVGATALFQLCLGWRGIGPDELAAQGADHVARLKSEFERLRTALLAELAAPHHARAAAVSRPH